MSETTYQEKLMHTYFGRCMSAPFLFFPDLWKPRPRATRQPADLVWACNNCILLMYFTHSKLHGRQDRRIATFQKNIRHNTREAQSSARLWKRMPITGTNDYHRFWLERKSATRVVVLSIIKTGHSRLSVDNDDHTFIEVDTVFAEKIGVRLFATIPQSIIEQLATSGGSCLDLLLFLKDLRGKGRISVADGRSMMAHYVEQCRRESESLKPESLPEFADFNTLAATITVAALAVDHTRHRPTRTRKGAMPTADSENIGARYGILADMDLADSTTIARAIALCTQAATAVDDSFSIELKLMDYDCAVWIARSKKHSLRCKTACESWAELRNSGHKRAGILFHEILDTGRLYANPMPRTCPSRTEVILDDLLV
jgi:hypothetical protein